MNKLILFKENKMARHLISVIESKVTKTDNKVYCEPLNGEEPFYVPEDQPVSMLMFGLTPVLFEELFDFQVCMERQCEFTRADYKVL